TLQMSLVIITGHVLATSPPMRRVIRALAALPQSPRAAVALVTFFALATAWLNWGFSLIFSAVLGREVARQVEDADYRALAAAAGLVPADGMPSRPGARLEHSRVLTWLVAALGFSYLIRYFLQADEPLGAITINTLNFTFLLVGFVLHGTPFRLMRAVQHA